MIILTRSFKEFIIIYLCVLIHELFHIAAARYFKVKIKSIYFVPFGVSLSLKNNYVYKPKEEIIISFAGPFANIIMIIGALFFAAYFNVDQYYFNYFLCANIFLFCLNIMPALPLDGGRILKAILVLFCSNTKAYKIVKFSTFTVIVLMSILGVYLVLKTKLNISIILICIFLFFNVINEKKQNSLIIMRGLIYHKEKLLEYKILKVKYYVVISSLPAKKIFKYLNYHNYCIFTVLDNSLMVTGTLTESQIINGFIKYGTNTSIGSLLNLINK